MTSLLRIITVLLLSFGFVFGQDPAQYGTPFSGVPDPRDAVIYQVNMRCFSAIRNFQGVINRLDNIKSLGVNVVYLMPVYPVGTLNAVNSPYCVKDYKAVGSEFGTLADLRNLIEQAHSRGIAVILDWVANHTSWDNAWIANKSWYQQDGNGNIVSPPGFPDVAQLNFANQDMRAAMIDAMRYWVFTANCDGFRCDFADNPPVDFWQQAIPSLRSISTHTLLLLAEGTRTANYSAGFDYNFGMYFYWSGIKPVYLSNGAVTAMEKSDSVEYAGASGTQQIVRYLTNHDVNGSEGTPLELFNGIPGSMAAFVVVAYMKGVPFIYNGQEVAFPTRIVFPFTSTTIDWTLNQAVALDYGKMIAFHNSSNAVRRGQFTSYCTNDVCAFTKIFGPETVLVISNLRNAAMQFPLPAALSGKTWKNVMTGASETVGSPVSLSAYAYKILQISPATSISAKQPEIPPQATRRINQFNCQSVFLKDIESGAVVLITDLQGREIVRKIIMGTQRPARLPLPHHAVVLVRVIGRTGIIAKKVLAIDN
jgi:glycosidase